jgi:phage baseplate assembly protein W
MSPAANPTDSVDFVGAGWSYPLGTDATGGVALVNRDRELEQAIRLILGTACGERPMRPEFGCRIHDHVFNTATSATAGQIAYDVRQALERWEPRIDVMDVAVSFDAMESGALYVDISYQVRGLNDPRNLVFPFYVIPHQEEPASAALSATALPATPFFATSARPVLNGGIS